MFGQKEKLLGVNFTVFRNISLRDKRTWTNGKKDYTEENKDHAAVRHPGDLTLRKTKGFKFVYLFKYADVYTICQRFQNTPIFPVMYHNSSHSSPVNSLKWYKGKWSTARCFFFFCEGKFTQN